MLTHFSFVFDRWTTTPTPPSEPTDGLIVTSCTIPTSLPCFGTCSTSLATRRLPHTVATHTVSSGMHALRSMWTSTHRSDSSMTAWFTTAQGDDLDNTLERAAHQVLMKFCECHLPGLDGTAIALFPIQNEGNAVWSERLAAVGYTERPAYHVGWAFTARYVQHVRSMLQEVMATGAY
jgi:hypothetical protein